jgi:hypothetical protein
MKWTISKNSLSQTHVSELVGHRACRLMYSAFLLCVFAFPAALGQEDTQSQLKNLELRIFRREFVADSDPIRIKRLEIMLFPGQKPDESMTQQDRIEKLLFRVEKDEREKSRQKERAERNMLQSGSSTRPDKSSRWNQSEDSQENLPNIDEPVVLILLDCSHSMGEKLPIATGGRSKNWTPETKLDMAKAAVSYLLQKIPSSVYLGLRVYGQGYDGDPFTDCKQSQLLIPPGKGNRREMALQLREIHPYGLTPLEYALRKCMENDLARFTNKKFVLLLADGSDTCGGHPEIYVREFKGKVECETVGIRLKHVDTLNNQIQAIAEATGGFYVSAATTADLFWWVNRALIKWNVCEP